MSTALSIITFLLTLSVCLNIKLAIDFRRVKYAFDKLGQLATLSVISGESLRYILPEAFVDQMGAEAREYMRDE